MDKSEAGLHKHYQDHDQDSLIKETLGENYNESGNSVEYWI